MWVPTAAPKPCSPGARPIAGSGFGVCHLQRHVVDKSQQHTKLGTSTMRPRNWGKTIHNVLVEENKTTTIKSPIWAVFVRSYTGRVAGLHPETWPELSAAPRDGSKHTNLPMLRCHPVATPSRRSWGALWVGGGAQGCPSSLQ